MKRVLLFLSATASLAAVAPVEAALPLVETYNFGVGAGLPDGNPSGLADVQNISGSQITEIQDLTVTLNLTGTFNGDLYVTLQHATGFSVLLNRVGRTGGNSFGFDDDGMTISLNDLGGASDVHGQTSGGGLLTGLFGSDGRTTDPNSVLGSDPRNALLDQMFALDANGSWILFAADLSGGDTHTLDSWSLEITGVPEPGTASLLVLGAALSLLGRRRR